MSAPATLRITEIFYSLQGEAGTAGIPTVFVRLTGCPLRCQYCDTAYAFEGGESRPLQSIIDEVRGYACRYVTVTGGEPLAQAGCKPLLNRLCDAGYQVSLETSGALPIAGVDERVSIVLDLKTPGSRESERNHMDNIAHLKRKDQVKFVICDRRDYEWSRACVADLELRKRVGEVLFSPSWHELDATRLAEWVLADALDVRVQLQLHKLLWGEQAGR